MCVSACKDGASDKHTSHARRVCEQISRHACAISIIESGCREPVCKATEKPADRLCPTFLPSPFPFPNPLPPVPPAADARSIRNADNVSWMRDPRMVPRSSGLRMECERVVTWAFSLSNYEAPPIRTWSCNFHLIPYNGYTRVRDGACDGNAMLFKFRWMARW